ncbi:sigma-E factor negative regulatory protein [Gammaproteobacteria bacterium]|nr:sigma-E factor negative regulatory protein [Gammaproteobacteria bacterium]
MEGTVSTDNEILSALLDGEATDFELRRLVADVQKSKELAEKWRRYSLVQDIIHSRDVIPSLSLSDRIKDYIEKNPQKSRRDSRWMSGVAKLAISASVAFAIVFSMPYFFPVFEETQSVVLNSSSKIEENNNISYLELYSKSEHRIDPAAKKRLDDYISKINFNGGVTETSGPLPIEALRDSPLYRLVNDTVDFPSR